MDSKFFMSVFVPFSIILPAGIGLLKLKVLPASSRIIWYYLLVSALVSFLAYFVGRVMHSNNLYLIHLYTPAELILFCWFYKKVLEAPDNSAMYWVLPAVFVILCIINAVFFQSIKTYSSYTRSIEALIGILFALNYFARLATITSGKKTIAMPEFYYNSGIFLYFSGSFMLFIFSNFIINSSSHDYYILWVIYSALVFCMYLFFSVGLLLCRK
jgi:hypothetical protein